MPLEALKNGRIQYACEDSSREFISLLACISADESALPPSLVYKGESDSLQDTWLEDWVPNSNKKKLYNRSTKSNQTARAAPMAKNICPANAAAVVMNLTGAVYSDSIAKTIIKEGWEAADNSGANY